MAVQGAACGYFKHPREGRYCALPPPEAHQGSRLLLRFPHGHCAAEEGDAHAAGKTCLEYLASLLFRRVPSEMYPPQTFVALVLITEKTAKWIEGIPQSMQAMTLWEVLWAEDYWNQMDKWMPAVSSRSHDQSLVRAILSLIKFKHLSVHMLLLSSLLDVSTHHLAGTRK